jgi:hypothetical protein
MREDLRRARENGIVLNSDLHLTFLCTPNSVDIFVDYRVYATCCVCSLGTCSKQKYQRYLLFDLMYDQQRRLVCDITPPGL